MFFWLVEKVLRLESIKSITLIYKYVQQIITYVEHIGTLRIILKNSTNWEYKLVQSVFLCIYFKTKWMNRSIKVFSIAAYYFFPSLRQFSNSISKKWLVFGGDPILEPIFDFCERSRWLAASFGTTSNQKEQCPENTAGAVKYPIWAFPNIFLRL